MHLLLVMRLYKICQGNAVRITASPDMTTAVYYRLMKQMQSSLAITLDSLIIDI